MSTSNNKRKKLDVFFTMLPNIFLDKYMFNLSGAAVKIYLVITRKTIGWGKKENYISYSQFHKFTGLSKSSISSAIKELLILNLIKSRKEGEGLKQTIYYEIIHEKTYSSDKKEGSSDSKIIPKEKNIGSIIRPTENFIGSKIEHTKESNNIKKEEEKEDPATDVELSNNAYQENKDTSSFSELKVKLKNYALTDNQIKKVSTEFDEAYIKNKIKQLEFLKKYHPEKIDGEGRYLYNSIIGKWDDQDYKTYLDNQNKTSQDSQKQIVQQNIQNEEELMKKEYERQREIIALDITERLTNEENDEIDKYIESKLQSPFYKNNKIIYDIAFRAKKIEYILNHYTKFLTFEDFVTQKNSSLKMAA